ncbi:MAG: hypothetical protein M1821_001944 [Bathelium mastoideum]|nr:MAG: hypothetical protein M1821_001944 [Bathelium mastoideum]
MATSDDDFDNLLSEFANQYALRSALINDHLAQVCRLLEGLETVGIKFQPITSRMKELESAVGSLKRRRVARLERQKLKERMERHNRDWEQYWKERNKQYWIPDFGPFPDCDAMFDALHDIGGARVLVYFPGDIQKVVRFLQNHSQIEVVQVLERGQRTVPELVALEKFINELEERPEQDPIDESMFSGYRATHIHVKRKVDSAQDAHADPNLRVVIEIQVATVVMNAWSQVEHDIIYKPAGAKPTEEEKRILDTFNGVVMTGECALRILEESFERKRQARDSDANSFATGLYDFGTWIGKHCADKSLHTLKNKRTQEWKHLEKLLDVLRAAGEHTSGKLRELINHLSATEVNDDTVFSDELPLFLMRQRFRRHKEESKFTSRPVSSEDQATVQSARWLALRVVHSLNMAAYLEIEDDFLQFIDKSLPEDAPRPSMIDFLDILHPRYATLNWKSEEKIIQFCKNFMDRKRLRRYISHLSPPKRILMELPTMLVEMGRIAYPLNGGSGGSVKQDMVVQRSLCMLLSDSEHAHWVPELCSVALDWTHHTDQENHLLGQISEPSGDRELTPLLLPPESSILATKAERKNWPAIPDEDHGVWTFKKIVGGVKFVWRRGGKTPATWWEMQFRDGNQFAQEYHAHKQASRPRTHPGQFRAVLVDGFSAPKWEYITAKPGAWEVKEADISREASQLRVRKISRESEFQDLVKALIPHENSKFSVLGQDEPLRYELKIGETEFCLQSLKSEFVLQKRGGTSGLGQKQLNSQVEFAGDATEDTQGITDSHTMVYIAHREQEAMQTEEGQGRFTRIETTELQEEETRAPRRNKRRRIDSDRDYDGA